MSAIAAANPIELAPPEKVLRPLAHFVPLDDEPAPHDGFQPWELHSELVLIDPELRRRSLELLPEIDLEAAPARSPQPLRAPLAPVAAPQPIVLLSPLAPTAPIAAPAPVEDERAVKSIGIFRYLGHRVVDITRLGLAIVGTIFVLAMVAELLAR